VDPVPRWRPVPVDPGTHAAVQNPSLSSWMSGFQIVRRNNSRHRRRRLSDRPRCLAIHRRSVRGERQTDVPNGAYR